MTAGQASLPSNPSAVFTIRGAAWFSQGLLLK
jgi:hypothetical protein